jgi:hypothetical protein
MRRLRCVRGAAEYKTPTVLALRGADVLRPGLRPNAELVVILKDPDVLARFKQFTTDPVKRALASASTKADRFPAGPRRGRLEASPRGNRFPVSQN